MRRREEERRGGKSKNQLHTLWCRLLYRDRHVPRLAMNILFPRGDRISDRKLKEGMDYARTIRCFFIGLGRVGETPALTAATDFTPFTLPPTPTGVLATLSASSSRSRFLPRCCEMAELGDLP